MSFNSMDQMNKGKGGYAAAVPKKRKPKSNENTKVVSLTVTLVLSRVHARQKIGQSGPQGLKFTPSYKKAGSIFFVLNMIFEYHSWSILNFKLMKAMLLAVAYAANIGGIGTLIGTPVNLILQTQMETVFENNLNKDKPEGVPANELNFLSWMYFALPTSIVCNIGCWLWLIAVYMGPAKGILALQYNIWLV